MVSAGWYDDPGGSGDLRYWDGSAWARELRPSAGAVALTPAGWYPDPAHPDWDRYWDGAAWTAGLRPPPGSVDEEGTDQGVDPWQGPGPDVDSTPEEPDEPDENLLRLGAGCLAAGAVDMMFWLAPVAVLGLLGLLLFNAGSKETQTDYYSEPSTTVNGTGWAGAGFICLAIAVFFGRGTIRSLRRVATRQGGLVDSLFVGSNIKSLLIAGLALAAGLFCFFASATGIEG